MHSEEVEDHVDNIIKPTLKDHVKSWKWALIPILYVFIDQYQGRWEVNSDERLDFYFIGMATWKVIVTIFILMDSKFLMNGTCKFLFVALFTWLVYELVDEIVTSGHRLENDAVLLYCVIVFVFLLLSTVLSALFSVIKDKIGKA